VTDAFAVVDYRPIPDLDSDLAELAYAAVRGWPDQRPYTAAYLRSILRPRGMTATTLLQHREDGRIKAAAAVRRPATLDEKGLVFGPVVHPSARRSGIGRDMLAAVCEIIASRPGVRFTTNAVPASRTVGCSLLEKAGWTPVRTSTMLQRELPAEILLTTIPVRGPRQGEYLDPAVAALMIAARPDLGYAAARDTLAQWRDDERYTPDGLLLVDTATGLAGAALVYPLANPASGEPPEARLENVLVDKNLDPDTATQVRAALVAAALHVGAAAGATVARAVADDPALVATLEGAGFEVRDEIRYYGPPAAQPALAGASSVTASA
jgi:GNAT superfamily N-acetyltransferase